MKTKPPPAGLHVNLEAVPLRWSMREIIQPEDHLVLLETVACKLVPIGAGFELNFLLMCEIRKEGDGLASEFDVIGFDVG